MKKRYTLKHFIFDYVSSVITQTLFISLLIAETKKFLMSINKNYKSK